MNKIISKNRVILAFMFYVLTTTFVVAQNNVKINAVANQEKVKLVAAQKINPTTIEIEFSNHQRMMIDFYGNNIFRMFQDNSGKGMRAPQAEPPAEILVKNPRKPVSELNVEGDENQIVIKTSAVELTFNKNKTTF